MSEIVSRFRNVAIGTVLLMATVALPATRTSSDGEIVYRNANPASESACEDSACRVPVYPDLANEPAPRDHAPARAAIMARYDADIVTRLLLVKTVIEGLAGRTKPDSPGPESSTLSSAQPLSAQRGSRRRADARAFR